MMSLISVASARAMALDLIAPTAAARPLWYNQSGVYHFTNKDGYLAISSQVTWRFRASKPPGRHPKGAYFTTLAPGTPDLADRLRIPREKLAYVFSFTDTGDLARLPGGRGEYVLYFDGDYLVSRERQEFCMETGL